MSPLSTTRVAGVSWRADRARRSLLCVSAVVAMACSSAADGSGRVFTQGVGGSTPAAGGGAGHGSGGSAGDTPDKGATDSTGGASVIIDTPKGAAGCESDAACVVDLPPRCGDSKIDAQADAGLKEECDDGNTTSDDGCSSTCTLEEGWSCPFPGVACEAASCGDGIRVGKEKCDFGSPQAEGCDPKTCTVDDGYACDADGCHKTVCGDGQAEGSEACDDGNDNWDDGCTPDCKREPDCSGSSCTTTCGDGLLLPGNTIEECDDGNLDANDGCSPDCTIEAGYDCKPSAATGGKLALPIVYRDMKKRQDDGGHPNFEVTPTTPVLCQGIAGPLGSSLDAEGKPAYAATPADETTNASNCYTTNATDFSTWFRDSDYSKAVIDTLTLTETPAQSGTFVFASKTFFPLDGKGWNDTPLTGGGNHNYSFTSELHYWFQWAGGETLTFFGDDDVFVYVNKKLVVDIGGIHTAVTASVTLDATTNDQLGLGLEAGSVYEIIVFQAERHITSSQYQLTLKGFNISHSVCAPVCGDGIVTSDELCDEGTEKNTGGYGHCAPDCKTRGGYCGDGILQRDGGESCDDGNHRMGDGCDSRCQFEQVH